jgi:hypothetical protein
MATQLVKQGQKDIVREGYFDLSPRSLSEAIQLAELMAKSDLIPAQFRNKPGDVMVAVQYGAELGLKPLQAMQSICIIEGRPTIWGDGALAVVLNSGLMENYKEMTGEEIKAAGKAVFWAKRKGTDEPIIREFSIEDAKKAGLWERKSQSGKAMPWTSYPYRMLQMRARSWGLRDGFADVLKGVSIREEIEDLETIQAPAMLAMPRRMSEREQIEAPVTEIKAEIEQKPLPCELCNKDLIFHDAGKTQEGTEFEAYWACPSYKKGNGHAAISHDEFLKSFERQPGQEG